jgi:hypothetical protein
VAEPGAVGEADADTRLLHLPERGLGGLGPSGARSQPADDVQLQAPLVRDDVRDPDHDVVPAVNLRRDRHGDARDVDRRHPGQVDVRVVVAVVGLRHRPGIEERGVGHERERRGPGAFAVWGLITG